METHLTDREMAVLGRFAQQQTNAEIATELALTVGTVKWYAQQIYNKLGVSDRKAAVARAQALGLLAASPDSEDAQPVPHNLPAQLTSFIGRETEIEQIEQLLLQARLLTLTGPGGVGKTRLAIRGAAEVLHHFPDGVFWVGLFALNESELIINEIAEVIGVRESGGETLLETVQRFLKQRRLLLVLDNYEHLLAGVGLIPALLTAAPHLRLLVTSREALQVIGEQEFTVGPLPVPDVDHPGTAEMLSHYAAPALFIQRARAVKPDLAVTAESAPVVAEICRRLDGLPLALELAAARCKLFSPQSMLARLDDRLTMLSKPLLDAAGRRQTLRATIDWSYTLLDDDEKLLFNRLSVFAGGWSLPAADAICSDMPPETVLNGLSSLTDKSLIRQESGADGEPRFRMLHILREYAQERLTHSPEADEIAQRHALHFLTVAQTAEPELHHAQQEVWLARLETDHDNLRLVLEWFLTKNRDDEALRLVAALGWFWVKQSHHSEGFRWVMRALEPKQNASPEWRARAILFGGARLAYLVETMKRLEIPLQEALIWARASKDRYCEAWALGYLGLYQAVVEDHLDESIRLCEQGLTLFRQTQAEDYGLTWILNSLGVLYALRKEYESSIVCYEEARAISRRNGDAWGTRMVLQNLGVVAFQQGNYDQAYQLSLELLPLIKDQSNRLYELADWLCMIGLICAAKSQTQVAVAILSGVDKLLTINALKLGYPENQLYDQCLANLRQSLDPTQFAQDWAQGQALTVRELVGYAVKSAARPFNDRNEKRGLKLF